MGRLFRTITPFIATFAAGAIGSLFVGSQVGSWYAGLKTPPFMPPVSLFPVAWTALYILMSCACAIAWRKEPQNAHTESWVRFYFVQLFLNMGWVVFFFGFHSITVSLLDTLILGFMVIVLTASGWAIDRRITYFMLPYALWIFFALYLTGGIWLLN
jgi:benzodiazapine receptor